MRSTIIFCFLEMLSVQMIGIGKTMMHTSVIMSMDALTYHNAVKSMQVPPWMDLSQKYAVG